ncbi:hypothetical protein MCOR27_005990 [Pyricularia oryzae]|nr:hypothetical protein MCOR19_006731 [Pyricularia oryzae]KAI6264008.1 hypothetical protein MCOR26_011658 [Pyricularia oryzae]KAI6277457.1 hypothetical protein MCOR27_005990 [Pyricularia oryzae]KAI6292111.1 hypothetical protein MCOR29_011702 [Pyricularia oryzae]KAI6354365.1 hypothetical protein MCOR31_011491 [Pyricularia oryzae]
MYLLDYAMPIIPRSIPIIASRKGMSPEAERDRAMSKEHHAQLAAEMSLRLKKAETKALKEKLSKVEVTKENKE